MAYIRDLSLPTISASPNFTLDTHSSVSYNLYGVDVMIGRDHPIFHMHLKDIPGAEPNDPIVRLTNLGWVRFRPTWVENFRRDTRSHCTVVIVPNYSS